MKTEPICVCIKDGKILIARKGKPFFPEPLSKDIRIIEENEEGFIIGPYPELNTMVMRFDQYHRMCDELKHNCPNAKTWRITAVVFICMFIILAMMHLLQAFYSKGLYSKVVENLWSKYAKERT